MAQLLTCAAQGNEHYTGWYCWHHSSKKTVKPRQEEEIFIVLGNHIQPFIYCLKKAYFFIINQLDPQLDVAP